MKKNFGLRSNNDIYSTRPKPTSKDTLLKTIKQQKYKKKPTKEFNEDFLQKWIVSHNFKKLENLQKKERTLLLRHKNGYGDSLILKDPQLIQEENLNLRKKIFKKIKKSKLNKIGKKQVFSILSANADYFNLLKVSYLLY